MDLSELLERYIGKHRLKAKTISVYHTTIAQVAEHLGRRPTTDDLTDDNLLAFERWFSEGRAAYTVRERGGRIKALWRFAAQQGIIHHWPSTPPYPIPEIAPRAYDTSQIERLIESASNTPGLIAGISAGDWWRAWIILAWSTGERTGALRKLRWEHVDLDRGILDLPGSIRKAGKAAVYDVEGFALSALRAIHGDWPLVFPFDKCDAMFYRRFNSILRAAGLPVGRRNQTQKIRRSHLTYWQAGGGDATARAQHSSSGVTWKHYLDRTLLPRDRPEDRLPKLKLFDAG